MKTDRRKFFKMAGISALAMGSIPSMKSFASPVNAFLSAKQGIEIGVASYSLRELNIEQVIQSMKELDLTRICLKSMHLPLQSSDQEIRQVISRLKQEGLDPYGCGVVYMKSKEDVDRAFHYAKVAGFKTMVGVPNYELLDYVEEKVKKNDIIVAIHNHGPADLPYPRPVDILSRIKGRDKRLGVCLDVAHVARIELDPVQAIRDCGDRLYDVHLRDNSEPNPNGRSTRPGKGSLDLPMIMKTLSEVNYKGVYAIEYENEKNNPVPGIAETAGYLRGIHDTLTMQ